jgi:hypothetical protein
LARAVFPEAHHDMQQHDRFTIVPDGESGLHYLCLRYKAFFGHIRPATAAMCQLG